MNPLRQAVDDYLMIRRALGYKLERHGRLLPQFVDYLDEVGATTVTVEHAAAWATQPPDAATRWYAERLTVVRGFAIWLATIEPATEIPPAHLLPSPRQRAVPYLYSDQDLAALLEATGTLRTSLGTTTYRTLIGLLAVTGLRIGEALRLDRGDVNGANDLLTVNVGKFGKAREIPLHPTTTQALTRYVRECDQLDPRPSTPALFISTVRTRLQYCNVQRTFRQLTVRAGLRPRSSSCRPRLHDLRHSFAVRTVLDGYLTDADVHARLPLLATFLGHADPAHTYWYLSAAPELLGLAGRRLEDHLEGSR
jgi:integrase